MDERALDPARLYLLKHTTRTVTAELDRALTLNQIGSVGVTTSQPLIFDPYADNRATGSFLLIDPDSNFTAGAGEVTPRPGGSPASPAPRGAAPRLAPRAAP